MPLKLTLLILICSVFSLPAQAGVTFSSGPSKVPLLELYTSEGCSSCPPADNWIGRLKDHPKLWQQVVPLAFHVDYWNYLGWNDPFASSQNSQRQYRYKHNGNLNAVYTPGFVYNGKESRSWFYRSSLPEINEDAGNLTITLNGKQITATFDSSEQPLKPLLLNIALLGFNLQTRVPAGENKGKILSHNFVVLSHNTSLSKNNQWRVTLPTTAVNSQKIALAAWVSGADNPTPIQATGGWLP
jgi:hypothetical protein